jgi:hypothetical protein
MQKGDWGCSSIPALQKKKRRKRKEKEHKKDKIDHFTHQSGPLSHFCSNIKGTQSK